MTKESISGKTLLARLATEEERQELADSQIDVILTEPIDFNAYVEVDVLPLPQDMEEGTFYITPDGEASFVAGGRVVTLLPESEIDEKISHLISIQVVEELPETGNEHTLYLVPLEDPEQQDVFDEYIWEGGAYEKIGNTRIDLSDYYTMEEVDAIIRENKGQAYTLSESDYNWNSQTHSATEPYNSIALWLLNPGMYVVPANMNTAWISLSDSADDKTLYIVGESGMWGTPIISTHVSNFASIGYTFGAIYSVTKSSGARQAIYNFSIVDDLDGPYATRALSANQGKVLKEMIDNNAVTRVQTTGQSTTNVMSQKATTDMVYGPYGQGIQIGANPEWDDSMGSIFIGKNAFGSDNYGEIVIGNFSSASGYDGSVALGYRTINNYAGAAVGAFSQGEGEGGLEDFGTISVGSKQSSTFTDEFGNSRTIPAFTRRVVNVKDPEDDQDAATKGYVDGLVGDIESILHIINNGSGESS